jgi:hypothetical protein
LCQARESQKYEIHSTVFCKKLCIFIIYLLLYTQQNKNMEMKPEESMKKSVQRRKRAVVSFILFNDLLFSRGDDVYIFFLFFLL